MREAVVVIKSCISRAPLQLQGLLEMGMASVDQPVLESPLLVLLLKLLQSLLAHGQLARARTNQQSWTSMLPQRVASTFDVLLVHIPSWL